MKKNLNVYFLYKESRTKIVRIMKLAMLFMLVGLLHASANSYSQNARISLDLKDAELKEVITEIQKQTEFIFFYSPEDIETVKNLNVKVENAKLQEILDECFENTGLEYEIKHKAIVLKKALKKEVSPVKSDELLNEQLQKKAISGKVTDSKGVSLPGVTVIVKGTTIGITTDFDGNYTLEIPDDAEILSFSFVGMKTQEIVLEGRTQISVVLQEETIGLDEVVAVGYGTQKKSNVTGAIASVRSEDLQNRSTDGVSQAIQGKVAGVQIVTPSGAPGASTSFRIRGYSSNGETSPLFIVDGLKVDNIDYLNSNNIESIEILKDAASAAIYGAEAGNGVVLITTKSGKSKEGKIFYNAQYSISSAANLPEVMQAEEFLNWFVEGGAFTKEYADEIWAANGHADTKWADIMYENGHTTKHTIGFDKSFDTGKFYASLGYLDNNGMFYGDKDVYNLITGQINASIQIKPWLKIGTNNAFQKSELKKISENDFAGGAGSATGGAFWFDPTVPIFYDSEEMWPSEYKNAERPDLIVKGDDGRAVGMSYLMRSNAWNPMAHYYAGDGGTLTSGPLGDNTTLVSKLSGILFAELNPIKNLIFTSRLGYNIIGTHYSNYAPPFMVNNGFQRINGFLETRNTNSDYFQWENFLNYSVAFREHNFNILAGMNYAKNRMTYTYGSTDRLQSEAENYRYLNFSVLDANDIIGGTKSEAANISYYGRVSWDYSNRYMMQVNFRADAFDSSKLSEKNRWGYFPSISAGWNITNESFMSDINTNFLSRLKLRASWGINGNVNSLAGYKYTTTLSSSDYYTFGGSSNLPIQGVTPSTTLPNEDLTWEESRQFNVGIDAGFFKNRLGVTIDWFDKTTVGMLTSAPAPMISGATTQYLNLGKINNRGLEFDLSWKDKIGKLGYSIRGNLATINNKVIESPYGTGRTVRSGYSDVPGVVLSGGLTAFEKDKSVWYIRGYKLDHVNPETGAAVYAEGEDDGMQYLGSGIPDFTYGITLSLDYKNFDLNVFGSGSQGNEAFMGLWRNYGFYMMNFPRTYYTDRWTEMNPNAQYPKLNVFDSKIMQSSQWLHNASYFRVKQIQLGYTLPEQISQKIKSSNLRLYVSLENYFTFTKYPGVDPESMVNTSSSLGIDYTSYPAAKKIMFGLNVAF